MSFWSGDEQFKNKEKTNVVEKKPVLKPQQEKKEDVKEPPAWSTHDVHVSPRELPHQVRSALGPGTEIDGKLRFDATVSIDGKLRGEVFSSEALIVGKSGNVDAQITVKRLVVYGFVKGTVKAERIDLIAGGTLEGDIECPSLSIEAGALFIGNSKMIKSKSESETRLIVDPNLKVEPKKLSLDSKENDKPKSSAQLIVN